MNEAQRNKGRVAEIRAPKNNTSINSDLLNYDNPPAIFQDNNLITYFALKNFVGNSIPPYAIGIVPAGTKLINDQYFSLLFDPTILGQFPTVIIMKKQGDIYIVNEPTTKFSYYNNRVLVYLENDGNGVTLDDYQIIAKR